jgi:hypothetical protein
VIFTASSKKDDNCLSLLDEINPIARAIMDSEFRDAIANGTKITWVVQ